MNSEDLARFEQTLGYPLPAEMAALTGKPPHLEMDVDRLIQMNQDVRIPGTPWIGEAGDPWPEDHVVIGGDQCGNYYSVLRPDRDATDLAPVWFFDHELGTLEQEHDSVANFQAYLEAMFPPEKFAVGDWTVRAQKSVGPVAFGMTAEEVRTALNAPYSSFQKSLDSPDQTDAFDTLDLHVYYRDGRCEAVEFFNAADVQIGGHRIGDETFANMTLIMDDHLSPQKITATSYQSSAYGVEFSIPQASDAEVVGAISMIIVTDAGYFERQDALLAAALGTTNPEKNDTPGGSN
jgi:hypothetical protein